MSNDDTHTLMADALIPGKIGSKAEEQVTEILNDSPNDSIGHLIRLLRSAPTITCKGCDSQFYYDPDEIPQPRFCGGCKEDKN